jgi:hypothetical protein
MGFKCLGSHFHRSFCHNIHFLFWSFCLRARLFRGLNVQGPLVTWLDCSGSDSVGPDCAGPYRTCINNVLAQLLLVYRIQKVSSAVTKWDEFPKASCNHIDEFLKATGRTFFADFFINYPAAFRNSLIWVLAAIRNSFVIIAAFSKTSINGKCFHESN